MNENEFGEKIEKLDLNFLNDIEKEVKNMIKSSKEESKEKKQDIKKNQESKFNLKDKSRDTEIS